MWPFTKKYTPPQEDPDSFGNIVVEKGYASPEKVQEAVKIQAERLPLGDILVSMGVLTAYQRDEVLLEQKLRRTRRSQRRISSVHIELERQRLVTHHLKNTLNDLTLSNNSFVMAHKK